MIIFGQNTKGNRNLFIWQVIVLQMGRKLWCWDPMFKKKYLSLLSRSPWDFNLSCYFQKIKHLTQAVLREREREKKSVFGHCDWLPLLVMSQITLARCTSPTGILRKVQRKPFSCGRESHLAATAAWISSFIFIYISSPICKKKPHQERVLECKGFEACLNIYLVFGSDLGSVMYCAATVMDTQTLDESKSNFHVSRLNEDTNIPNTTN